LGDSGGNNQALEEQHILVLLPVQQLLRLLEGEVRGFLSPETYAPQRVQFRQQ